MGRQGSDPTMVSSSIALLQERFRQLQRVKERREEKELLKLFSESERIAPAMLLDSGKLLSGQPETIRPYRQPLNQDFLSLGPNSNQKVKCADSRPIKKTTPRSSSLWPVEPNFVSPSNSFDSSDVDTSLHL
ncbi:hypothetical protein PVL29_015642 [Vitis rotundifolia]|uniref:Uncharacterized protein n=1 Tax=Vitis rotundifolia TaxID=103349 RepID=A0AA39DLY8_VITRO|nr:hypothetical protein PVL29_015642 [Vitis rotundifolia]